MMKLDYTEKTREQILEQLGARLVEAEAEAELQSAVDEANENGADNDKPKLRISFSAELAVSKEGGIEVGSEIGFVVRKCKIRDKVVYPPEDGQMRIE